MNKGLSLIDTLWLAGMLLMMWANIERVEKKVDRAITIVERCARADATTENN